MMFLGMCITEWANIEAEIFEIFNSVLGTDLRHSAILFYSTPTLETRLALCTELLATVFPSPEKKDGGHKHRDHKTWDSLLVAIRKEMPIRNRLAHSPVAPYIQDKATNWYEYFSLGRAINFRLYTPLEKKHRSRHASDAPIELEDLKRHLKAVAGLVGELQRFRLALREHTAKLRLRPQPSQDRNPSEGQPE